MEYYNKLPKYFINLDTAQDRLQQTIDQVGIQDDGLNEHPNFTRFPAVSAGEWSVKELGEHFDFHKFSKTYGLVPNPSTCYCLLSHFNLYKKFAQNEHYKDNDWLLIAEDDTTYYPNFKERVDKLLAELAKEEYDNAELVILKLYNADDHFDNLSYVLKEEKKKEIGTLSTLLKDRIPIHFRTRKSWVREVKDADFRIFASAKFAIGSASLYLIRKKTCQRLVNDNPKPWWFADEFNKIVPIQNILYVSIFFGRESVEATASTINNISEVPYIYEAVAKQPCSHHYRETILYHLPFLMTFNYSPLPWKRKFAKVALTLLCLNRAF